MVIFYAGGEFSTLDAEEKKGERRGRLEIWDYIIF